MFLFKTKFYFYLGKKNYNKSLELLNEYKKKKGETYNYFEKCVNYYYELNDSKNAFASFKNCLLLKRLNQKFENWGIEAFITKNVLNHNYQLAAKNAMEITDLENLSTKNRVQLLKILDYIKTKIKET